MTLYFSRLKAVVNQIQIRNRDIHTKKSKAELICGNYDTHTEHFLTILSNALKQHNFKIRSNSIANHFTYKQIYELNFAFRTI